MSESDPGAQSSGNKAASDQGTPNGEPEFLPAARNAGNGKARTRASHVKLTFQTDPLPIAETFRAMLSAIPKTGA